MPLSDDFSSNRFGVLWGFYNPGPNEMSRVQYQTKALRVAGKGSQPSDCSPMSFITPDVAYRVTVDIELEAAIEARRRRFRRAVRGRGRAKKARAGAARTGAAAAA
jgi:hypothetical protein